jgi:GTP-binding protein
MLGRSNVGKSSLLNRLLGRRSLAHTSKTTGKRRLLNVYAPSDACYLVDLPGYGYARAPRGERRGFARLIKGYLLDRERLVGVVWLLDIRRNPSNDDLEMAELLADRGVPVLVAVTKADKVNRGGRGERVGHILEAIAVPEEQCVVTSARTREGTDALREAVEELVAAEKRGMG